MLRQRQTSPQEVFWQACDAARTDALKTGLEVTLSFDDKTKAFVCNDGQNPPATLPVPSPDPDLAVDFHANDPSVANEVLIGGTLVETHPLPSVSFFSDGTCSPFHVQFRAKSGAYTVAIDPWTCAKALPAIPPAGR
jgi:hypothetical protein